MHPLPSIDLVVLADDRTGALETAGMCADLIGPITVHSRSTVPAYIGPSVLDMGTRHTSPEDAAATVTRMALSSPATVQMLKIDSTLRGNWAAEAVALARITGRPGLVVASFPALGRTCVGGRVLVDTHPVHRGAAAQDARRGITSSRPREHLLHAGAASVAELDGIDALAAWLRAPSTEFAVCDAEQSAQLVEIGRSWAGSAGISFIGTAASIAEAVGALVGDRGATVRPPLPERVLVACGSLHPVARAQVATLRECGIGVHRPTARWSEIHDDLDSGLALVCSAEVDAPITAAEADAVATALAACIRPIWDERPALADAQRDLTASTHQAADALPFDSHDPLRLGLLIIGGDTAAAVLGDAAVLVGGTLAPGLPWAIRHDRTGPLIMTRAGGFGTASSLAELLSDRLPR